MSESTVVLVVVVVVVACWLDGIVEDVASVKGVSLGDGEAQIE